jgi:hypothetical protein
LSDPFAEPEPADEVVTRQITVVHHRSVPPPPPPPPRQTTPNKPFFIGGYGGMSTRVTNVSKKVGILMGFRGGILLGERMSIGGAYYNLRRRYGAPILDDNDVPMALKMGYGGAQVGVTLVRHDNLEFNVSTLVGAGMACVSYDTRPSRGAAKQHCEESVRMIVAEPEAQFNVTVTDWMRFGLSAGYRIVAREKWTPPNNFGLSGAHFGLNLEFGWFGR